MHDGLKDPSCMPPPSRVIPPQKNGFQGFYPWRVWAEPSASFLQSISPLAWKCPRTSLARAANSGLPIMDRPRGRGRLTS